MLLTGRDMSPIAELRRDHRQLLTCLASLSPTALATGTAAGRDHVRQRIGHIARHFADHVQRESAIFGIRLGISRMARWCEVLDVTSHVSAFATRWQIDGAIEANATRYADEIIDLRPRIERLVRRDEDCMFDLMGGSSPAILANRTVHGPCPGLWSAVRYILVVLDALRSDMRSGKQVTDRQVCHLRYAAEQMIDREASIMAGCLPVGAGDLLHDGLRLREMLDAIDRDRCTGHLRSAGSMMGFLGRWLHVHVAEIEDLLVGFGCQAYGSANAASGAGHLSVWDMMSKPHAISGVESYDRPSASPV